MTIKKEIIKDIQKVDKQTDGYLSYRKYISKGNYGSKIYKHFNTWAEAKKQAGLVVKGTSLSNTAKKVEQLLKQGKTRNEIMKKLGISKSYFYTIINTKLAVDTRNKLTVQEKTKGKKRLIFNVKEDVLKKADIPLKKDKPLYYTVKPDKDNNTLIFEFHNSKYIFKEN